MQHVSIHNYVVNGVNNKAACGYQKVCNNCCIQPNNRDVDGKTFGSNTPTIVPIIFPMASPLCGQAISQDNKPKTRTSMVECRNSPKLCVDY